MKPFPRTEISDSGQVKFCPEANQQRQDAVYNIINSEEWSKQIKTIVDFGCGELRFFKVLKTMEQLDSIICIDIDEEKLKLHGEKANPAFNGIVEYMKKPLKVDIYHGDIGQIDSCIKNSDAIICIEVIEHLFPNELDNLPYTIFGFAKPKLVVITTPNVEFNIVFSKKNKMRHEDHKFEWTRVQFRDWASNIIQRYPDYAVEFQDIVVPPKGYESIGPLTQMAVFHKQTKFVDNKHENDTVKNYELIYSYEYPVQKDLRETDDKILQEFMFYLTKYSDSNDQCEQHGDDSQDIMIPLKPLFKKIKSLVPNLRELESLLIGFGYTITKHNLILSKPKVKYNRGYPHL